MTIAKSVGVQFFGVTYLLLCIFNSNQIAAQPQYDPRLAYTDDNGILFSESIDKAIDRSATLLRASCDRYPSHRQCFSCHHQTLPLLAFKSLERPYYDLETNEHYALFESDQERVKAIVTLTTHSLEGQLNELGPNDTFDGKDLAVGYGLWTLEMAHYKRDPLTDRLVEYLIRSQQADGNWVIDSLRAPAASSNHMATAIAMLGLARFGLRPETLGVDVALLRASIWHRLSDKPKTIEDLAGWVWCEYLLHSLQTRVDRIGDIYFPGPMRKSVLSELSDRDRSRLEIVNTSAKSEKTFDLTAMIMDHQQPDGGWAQEPGMKSDAYATGLCMVLLAQVDSNYKFGVFRRKGYLDGIKFLIESQHESGAWFVSSRANPVQEYFDNGDPFERDQFISMMATGWATAALATAKHVNHFPLGDPSDFREPRKGGMGMGVKISKGLLDPLPGEE